MVVICPGIKVRPTVIGVCIAECHHGFFVMFSWLWPCNNGTVGKTVFRWQVPDQDRFVVKKVQALRRHSGTAYQPCIWSYSFDCLELPLSMLAPLFKHASTASVRKWLNLEQVLNIMCFGNLTIRIYDFPGNFIVFFGKSESMWFSIFDHTCTSIGLGCQAVDVSNCTFGPNHTPCQIQSALIVFWCHLGMIPLIYITVTIGPMNQLRSS